MWNYATETKITELKWKSREVELENWKFGQSESASTSIKFEIS